MGSLRDLKPGRTEVRHDPRAARGGDRIDVADSVRSIRPVSLLHDLTLLPLEPRRQPLRAPCQQRCIDTDLDIQLRRLPRRLIARIAPSIAACSAYWPNSAKEPPHPNRASSGIAASRKSLVSRHKALSDYSMLPAPTLESILGSVARFSLRFPQTYYRLGCTHIRSDDHVVPRVDHRW